MDATPFTPVTALVGGALYQLQPTLPYVFAAVVYVILMGFMQWLGNRVAEHAA